MWTAVVSGRSDQCGQLWSVVGVTSWTAVVSCDQCGQSVVGVTSVDSQ